MWDWLRRRFGKKRPPPPFSIPRDMVMSGDVGVEIPLSPRSCLRCGSECSGPLMHGVVARLCGDCKKTHILVMTATNQIRIVSIVNSKHH